MSAGNLFLKVVLRTQLWRWFPLPLNFGFCQNPVGEQLFLQLFFRARSLLSGAWPIITLRQDGLCARAPRDLHVVPTRWCQRETLDRLLR